MKLHISRTTGKMILIFLAAALVEFFLFPLRGFPFYSVNLFWALLIVIGWYETVKRRIVNKDRKQMMGAICIMMEAFLCVVIFKYTAVEAGSTLERYLWYLYYIPFLFIPLLILSVADSISAKRIRTFWKYPPALFCLALFVLIMTNDLHHLVFSFPQGAEHSATHYHYEAGYYVILLWILSLLFRAIHLMAKNTHLTWDLKNSCLPVGVLLICALLSYLTVNQKGILFSYKVTNVPVVFCLSTINILEICIQLGLIPSNSDYDEVLSLSHISAEVVDHNNEVRISSASGVHYNKEEIETILKGTYRPDRDTEVHAQPIRGGYIFYQKDLSRINRMIEELQDTVEQLSRENDIQKEENRLLKKKAAIETETAIFAKVDTRIIQPMEYLNTLYQSKTSDRKTVREALPILVYVKRTSNLILKEFNKEPITSGDVSFVLQEVFQTLTPLGITTSLDFPRGYAISSDEAYRVLETFYEIYSSEKDHLKGILVSYHPKEQTVRFVLETEGEIVFVPQENLRMTSEENTVYLDVILKGEEA